MSADAYRGTDRKRKRCRVNLGADSKLLIGDGKTSLVRFDLASLPANMLPR